MAKNMSIIRYKYKADRDFESVQFEGLSCSLGELKRLIIEKSTRSGSHHSRDDFDLIISDSTTHEEYKDFNGMIERNTSVIVTRRMRGTLESLTPLTTRKSAVSSDDIINKYLRPVVGQSTIVETKAVPLESLNQPTTNSNPVDELSEEERLKQVLKSSQSAYMPVHRSNTSYICHTCKQPGHLRSQCPLLLQSSSANGTGHVNDSSSSSSVNNDFSSKNGGTQSTNSSLSKPGPYASHIITNQQPYHRHRPPRHVNVIKRPTGIPQDGLIRVPMPVPMPGVLIDKTGHAVVPKPMAALLIENSDRKADALAKRAQQFEEKGVSSPASSASMLPMKTADDDRPPDDLICSICKQIYFDAVITPCCHNSFCNDCIRNALIESEDHKCPHCHRKNVRIDHINPNLILRKHVNEYKEERQQKSSYSYMSLPPQSSSSMNYLSSQTHEHTGDSMGNKLANNQNLDELDEYDAAILPASTQQPVVPIKNAPIVIKMKPIGRSPSPSSQPSFETKSNDITSEDDKTSDNDQSAYSQKEKNVEVPTTNTSSNDESSDKLTDSNISENDKSDRHTPPSQVAPVSTILSSPPTTTATTMTSAMSVVPHYYPVHPHMPPHGQHIHPSMMYPPQIPPTSSAGLYSMPPNFYPPAMHVPYPGAPSVLPVGGMTHYPGHHSAYPPMHPHHSMAPPHLQAPHLNGYPIPHYESLNVPSLHHPNPSGSTLIHQANKSIIKPTLTEDEFYSKQRSLQRIKRSTSRRRSSSHSSYTSNDSRTSSFSRRNDRHRRRSSRSRSRQRIDKRRRDNNRTISPTRQQRRRSSRSKSKQRRSPARRRSPTDRNRTRTLPSSKDNHSSNYRRTSPIHPPPPPPPSQQQRSTRDRERRRSPRPPPTIPQSTQRTIVYSHDSGSSKQHSNRDNRRSKSRSRHRSRPNDDRTAPSSKINHHSPSKSRKSVSPIAAPPSQRRVTLSSIITPVIEENSSKKTSTSQAFDENNDKKRKKTHQQSSRKHRRHQSPDRKIRHSQNNDDDDDDANIVVENSTADSRRVIEAQ